jgi:hypothetical protein
MLRKLNASARAKRINAMSLVARSMWRQPAKEVGLWVHSLARVTHTTGIHFSKALEQVHRISPKPVEHVFVDLGYRGDRYVGDVDVHVCTKRKGKIKSSTWKWMKRRAAVEPTIGHLKRYHGMDRNAQKGSAGDMLNAILNACGLNFSKLLKQLFVLFYLWLQRKSRSSDNSYQAIPLSCA